MTQGQLGSLIALSIDLLRGPGSAASLITHVTVDQADPAFLAPTKPIGPFFDRAQAERLAAERGWVVQPDSGHGYRRVVASPEPAGIVEIDAIRALVDAGLLVIAAGGGGIPLAGWDSTLPPGDDRTPRPRHDGMRPAGSQPRSLYADAVIDKDRAARLLATLIGAQALLLVTAVDRVMLNYGTPQQTSLATISADEAARYLAAGSSRPGAWVPRSGQPCGSSPTAGSLP